MKDRPNRSELHLLSAELRCLKAIQGRPCAFRKGPGIGPTECECGAAACAAAVGCERLESARTLIEQLPQAVREGDLGQVYAEVLDNSGRRRRRREGDPEICRRVAPSRRSTARAGPNADLDTATAPNQGSTQEGIAGPGGSAADGRDARPEVPQTWLALLTYQLIQRDSEGAKQTMQRAQLGLPEDQLVAIMAKGNEIIGRWFNAENIYHRALSPAGQFAAGSGAGDVLLEPGLSTAGQAYQSYAVGESILGCRCDGKLKSTICPDVGREDRPARYWRTPATTNISARPRISWCCTHTTGSPPAEDRIPTAEHPSCGGIRSAPKEKPV